MTTEFIILDQDSSVWTEFMAIVNFAAGFGMQYGVNKRFIS